MPVEQQIMIIYAVTNGYLDDIPVEDPCLRARFPQYMAAQYPQVGRRSGPKDLTPEIGNSSSPGSGVQETFLAGASAAQAGTRSAAAAD